MADETPDPEQGSDKTFTQADLDRILADRLSREKGKYADYDDLKAKAAKLDEQEAANKSDIEKATAAAAEAAERAAAAELRALRLEVAGDKGLSPSQAKRLVGTTREELEADADELLADFPPTSKPSDKLPTRPKPKKGGASDPDPGDLKGKERAAAAFRQFTRN